MFGYSQDEAIGKHLLELTLLEQNFTELEQILDRLRHDLHNHQPGQVHINQNRTQAGDVILCEWQNVPLYDPQGKLTGAVSIAQDVTHRVQTQAALEQANQQLEQNVAERTAELQQTVDCLQREILERRLAEEHLQESQAKLQASEQKYQQILNAIPDMLLVKGEQSKIVWANQAFCDYYGMTATELKNLIDAPFSPPDQTQQYVQDDAYVFQTGQRLEVEEPVTCHNGTTRLFNTLKSPIRDDQGNIIMTVGISRDITEAKQAEIALYTSQQRFASLAAAVPVGIFQADAQGACIYVNERLCDMTGLTPETAQGHGWSSMVHPEDRDRVFAAWRQFTEQNQPFHTEYRFQRADGSVLWVLGQAVLDQTNDGQVIGYIGTITDITERKQAEKEQARLVAILEATTDFVGIASTDGESTYLNHAAIEMVGLTPEDISRGLHIRDLCAPSHHKMQFEEALPTAIRDGFWSGESMVITRDGREIPISQVIIAHRGEDGTLEYLSTIARDISDRKRTEKTLLHIRAAVDSTSDAIGIADTQGQSVFHNPAMEELLGYTVAELNAAGGPSILYADAEQGQAVFTQIMQGKAWSGETELRHRDGHHITVALRANAIRDASGQIVGLIGSHTDITRQKQIERELYANRQLLRNVMDALPQYTFWKSRDSVYLGCNRRFAQLVGLDEPEQIAGKTDYDLPFEKSEADWYLELDQRVMGNNQPIYNVIEPQQKHADGRQRWSETNKVPLHDEQGNVIGILGTFQDVTERIEAQDALRQSEAELRQKADELEEALQELRRTQMQLVQTEKMSSLGQLVAGVAHEINNPVNFIHGNVLHAHEYINDLLEVVAAYQTHCPNPGEDVEALVEEVELDFLVEDVPKLLHSMQEGTRRIREIVVSLRNFSRLDEAEVKDADIHAGLDSTLMILHNRLKSKSDRPEIQVSKHYGDLPCVECYPGQLNQVFMNILTNAIDALEDRDRDRDMDDIKAHPSQISITTEPIPGRDAIRITLRDNGPGIPPKVQSRIFDPFFTTKPIGKGTGLGMSISYQIITDKHHGQLTCHSSPEEGTEFVIELPTRLGIAT